MFASHSSTIVSMEIPKGDISFPDSEKHAVEELERRIEQVIIPSLGSSERWSDPEFGPDKECPSGNTSIYKSGEKTAPGCPSLESICWKRPCYKTSTNDEYFCQDAKLFLSDSMENNPTIQGKLGDGWLLGAFAILATRPRALRACFWNLDKYKNFGIYVCKIMKGFTWHYVIIDDRIPVFNCRNGKPCFGHSKVSNELWVSLLEKAYAKLSGSYDSLIGGYLDEALRELTGTCSERIVLSKSDPEWDPNSPLNDFNINRIQIWKRLYDNFSNLLCGCVIKPEKKPSSMQVKPLHGLTLNHAYAVVGMGTVDGVKLVRLHNPWSFGEWNGPWGDDSSEREKYSLELERIFYNEKFPVTNNSQDGTFFMDFDTFLNVFSVIYCCVGPSDVRYSFRMDGTWNTHNSGGNIMKRTWINNPKYIFEVRNPNTNVFIEVCRYYDMNQSKGPFGFCICPVSKNINGTLNLLVDKITNQKCQDGNNRETFLSNYSFRPTCSKYLTLSNGYYAIVPSQYERNQIGKYYITVYADNKIKILDNNPWRVGGFQDYLSSNPLITEDEDYRTVDKRDDDFKLKATMIGSMTTKSSSNFDYDDTFYFRNAGDEEFPSDKSIETKTLAEITHLPKLEEYEQAKEKLVKLAKAKGITMRTLMKVFEDSLGGDPKLSRYEFKERMVGIGFHSSELPDTEFTALAGEDGFLSSLEFRNIFKEQIEKEKIFGSKPQKPDDDLIFRPVSGIEGTLNLQVVEALDLDLDKSADCCQAKTIETASTKTPFFGLSDKYVAVYISSPMIISGKQIILRLWGVPNGTNFSFLKSRSLKMLGTIPIAYSIGEGKDYGLEGYPIIPNATVLNGTMEKEWSKTFSLNSEPLECLDEDGFISNRNEYIKKCIAYAMNDGVNLGDKTNLEYSDGENLSRFPAPQEPKCKTLLPSSSTKIYLESIQTSTAWKAAEQTRSQNFLRLKKMGSTARKAHISCNKENISAQGEVELNQEEILLKRKPWQESTRLKNRVVLAAKNGGEIDPNDLKTMENIFEELILGDVDGYILIEDQHNSQYQSEDIDCKQSLKTKNSQLIYSRVLALSGEEKVREELLDRSKNMKAWFGNFDIDNNGFVDQHEFSQAILQLGLKITKKELNVLLNRFDTDGDGKIQYEEFVAFTEMDPYKQAELEQQNRVCDTSPSSNIEKVLTTIISKSCDISRISDEPWSIGYNPIRLSALARQLKEICTNKTSRRILSEEDCAARISYIFENGENMSLFLSQKDNHIGIAESIEAGSKLCKQILVKIAGINSSSRSDQEEIDLDLLLSRLQIRKGDSGPTAKSLVHTILFEHARQILSNQEEDIGEEGFQNAQGNEENVLSKTDELLSLFNTQYERLKVDQKSNKANSGVEVLLVPKAVQIRAFFDTFGIRSGHSIVSRNIISQLVESETARDTIEVKLRQLLREHENLRDGNLYYLVDIYAKSQEELDKDECTIQIAVRSPGSENFSNSLFLELEDFTIPKRLLPKAPGSVLFALDTLPGSKAEKVYSASSYLQENKICEFFDDLCSRLVISRKGYSHNANDVLQLQLAEDAAIVDRLRTLFDMCNFPFLVSISNLDITFTVDPELNLSIDAGEIKKYIFEHVRNQQNGSVLRHLMSIPVSSNLLVVFRHDGNVYRETMSWKEFMAHLTNRRNPFVEICLKPGQQTYSTPLAKDGGMHPIFPPNNVTFLYTPSNHFENHMRGREVRFTRVCFVQKEHVILSVYDSVSTPTNFDVVAYDPKSQRQFDLCRKVTKTEGKGRDYQNKVVPFSLPKTFDLHDETSWEKALASVILGGCLTSRLILKTYCGEGLLVGEAEIPISIATNEPGREVKRWFTLRKNFKDTGTLNIALRFDQVTTSNNSVDATENAYDIEANTSAQTKTIDPFQPLINNGDEAFAPDDMEAHIYHAHQSTNTAKEYAQLAQRLREEIEEKANQLKESDKTRAKLEATCRSHELDLRRARNELERRQQKLDEALLLRKKLEPSRPNENANRGELERYHELEKLHTRKLEELEDLREENRKLQNSTRMRGHQVNQEVQELRAKLAETERRLRSEISEKQEIMIQFEESSHIAQQNAATSLQRGIYEGNKRPNTDPNYRKRQRAMTQTTRENIRRQRGKHLKERMGPQYKVYENELKNSLVKIVQQLVARRPGEPEKPILGLEKLLYSVSNGSNKISVSEFEESIVDFGVSLNLTELEMVLTHFDLEGDDTIDLDAFFDHLLAVLRDPLTRDKFEHPAGSGISAVRGINTEFKQSHVPRWAQNYTEFNRNQQY